MKLQGPYTDVARAYSQIDVVKAAIQKCRYNVDQFHVQIYERAVIMAKNVDVEETMPRLEVDKGIGIIFQLKHV